MPSRTFRLIRGRLSRRLLNRVPTLQRSLSLEEEMTRTWRAKNMQASEACPRRPMTRLQTVQCQKTATATLMKKWHPLKPMLTIVMMLLQEEQEELLDIVTMLILTWRRTEIQDTPPRKRG